MKELPAAIVSKFSMLVPPWQIRGLAGCALLILGLFCPLIIGMRGKKNPMTLLGDKKIAAIVIMVLACAGVVSILIRRPKWLSFCGVISLWITLAYMALFLLLRLFALLNYEVDFMRSMVRISGFKWGFLVLVAGGALVMSAAEYPENDTKPKGQDTLWKLLKLMPRSSSQA